MAVATGTAILGSAAIGAVGSALAGSQAASAQSAATRAQAAANAQQLAFQQQQYDDWQAVYGPIQENLSSFYQQLTPETLVASGLQNLQTNYANTQEQFQRTFAQRGITTGAQAMLEQQAALTNAEQKAAIRTNAPMQVATAQQGFLNQNVTNPATARVANAMQSQANFYGSQATMYGNQAATAYNQMGQAIQTGIGSYVQNQQYQQLMAQQAPQAFQYTSPSVSSELAAQAYLPAFGD